MPFDDGVLTCPPGLDLSAGYVTAARLRHAGRTAAGAATSLDGTMTPSWAGAASEAATQARVLLAARVRSVAFVCSSFAAAVEVFLDEVGSLLPRWRYAVDEWHQLEDAAVLLPHEPVWRVEAVAAEERAHRLAVQYEQAASQLSAATDAAVEGLDVVRTWQDQVSEGLAQATNVLLVEPFTSTLYLGLGWTTDRAGWWGTVRSFPGTTWDAVTHPRRTAGEMVGEQHWRNGDWGLGAGTAVGIVGLRRLRPRVGRNNREQFPDAVWDRSRPEPRVQSVDEMLAGVDLDAHESGALGHTLRRHVVSDEYLADRVTNGTIRDDWTRGTPPPRASAWTDRETAEVAITEALRSDVQHVRDFAAGLTTDGTVEFDPGRQIGTSVDSSGVRTAQTVLTVQLGRRADGSVYIVTAFPGRWSS